MKILFYTNIPSPYRVAFFNELGKHCDLTVVFETATSTERDDEWKKFEFKNFKGIILKGIRTRVDAAFCPGIIRYLKKNVYDYIVVTQLASLTAIWAVAYMRIKGISYCYEGDGGFVGKTKGFKAALKRFVIKNAIFCFSTSKEFDEYCVAYGAEKSKIFRYPFTSIENKDLIEKPLTKEQKDVCKKKLNMKEDLIVLTVGRFIHIKGFDLLLEACKFLPSNVGVYFVGGKPTDEYLEMKDRWDLKHAYFLDFMNKEQLAEYYQAADVFVLPTRSDVWGLVINEAMAYALPVVTTDRCIAGLELIEDAKNGFVIKTDNVKDLAKKVLILVESESIREKCAEGALETIATYTIEKMAESHIKVFNLMKK